VTVNELKFLQVQGYIAELQIASKKLLKFGDIPFLDATYKSENSTTSDF